MSQEIDLILNSYHSTTLWEIASAANLPVSDRQGKRLRKTEIIRQMKAGFFAEERVCASLTRLDQRERAVLDRLLLLGGVSSTKRFQREIMRARLATHPPKRDTYYHGRAPYAQGYAGHPNHRSRVFEDVIARLTYHGLVFSRDPGFNSGGTPYKLQFHPGATLFIPDVIQRYLPEPEPLPSTTTAWQPARVATGQPALLLRDLYLYWDFVRRNEVTLIQSGLVGKRSLKALNDTLLVPDPSLDSVRREDETGRLFLLRRLLESLQLVGRTTKDLRPTGQDPRHVPEFWNRATTEQLSACLEAWLAVGEAGVLANDALQYGPRYAHAQRAVVDVLKTLPLDTWLEPEDLLERVQEQDKDFLFPEHSRVENYRGSWYYGHASGYFYGHPDDLTEAFDRFEDEFVKRCLSGFLYQIGVVELGYGHADQDTWEAFRRSATGQHILGTAPVPQADPSEQGRLVVQPNFQLIALGPVRLGTLAQLDLFADREQADRGAFQYRLSRESVYRAQQAGLEVTGVMAFLEKTAAVQLPQNVLRSLEEWGVQHEQIVFRTGVSLLQAADAHLLDKLMKDPRVGEHLARSVNPDVALLRKNRENHLISALVAQGLFPALSGATLDSGERSVVIDKDGTIRPVHAVPALHLRGRLSLLAEQVTDAEWRLTPDAVRRAGGSKNKVLGLLDELRALHRGPFPATLVEQIKAWGNYYGHASSETLTLIEFRDKAALEELRARPELTAHLIPFPAGERALAVVATHDLPQVKEILARFGVRVTDHLRSGAN